MQTAAVRFVDPLFARRHPGALLRAAIRGLQPLIRQLQPNDRWNLDAFLEEWTALLAAPPLEPRPQPKRIFIFTLYRGQYTQDIVLALLLAWRGHGVTLGYLPKLQSPIKDPLADDRSAPDYLAAVLGRLEGLTGGRVRCIDLRPFESHGRFDDEVFHAAQLRADIIMRVRQERYDVAEPDTAFAQAYYDELGRRAQRIAFGFFAEQRNAFDLCIIANGASFESGHVCFAAKRHGIPVTTHEKFAFNRVKVVTHGDAFFHFSDLDRIWNRRRALGFLDEPLRGFAIDKAWQLLDQRRTSSGSSWGWQYQKGRPSRDVAAVRRSLGLDDAQFALVCPNVPFDAGYDGWLRIFPSMRDWLVETVATLLRHRDLRVVVRAHPAETRSGYGRERIDAVLAQAGIASPRLVLVPGDGDVNTYDLMPLCRFAAVFASTTGVEIAMHGKPVIAGASVYYARCGITVPAADRDAYFRQLDSLADGATGTVDADDAAQLYFLFHYLLQWPYPYDKPSQIVALPPRHLPAIANVATYVETLDVLAMTPSEFEAALPRLTELSQLARRWGWPVDGQAPA
jgi:hypothetical protein